MTQEPTAAPVQYLTLHPLAQTVDIVRIATQHVGGWGEHYRNLGEPPRTYVITVWGQEFDCAESLAELDALMGFEEVTPFVAAPEDPVQAPEGG